MIESFLLAVLWASFFSEYALHRWLFHGARSVVLLRSLPPVQEHVRHHVDGFFAPSWIKAVFVVPPLFIVPWLVTGSIGFAAGLAAYYVSLEALHWMMHWTAPATAIGLYLRRSHFHHHFSDARVRFGFTLGLVWDVMFGTLAPMEERVAVPRHYPVPWLHDGNHVNEKYAAHFRLK